MSNRDYLKTLKLQYFDVKKWAKGRYTKINYFLFVVKPLRGRGRGKTP